MKRKYAFIALLINTLALLLPTNSVAQSLWVTLRKHPLISTMQIDSITPAGDTLRHEVLIPDSTSLEPIFSPSQDALPQINTSSFLTYYKPVQKPINFQSQFTAAARRDSFLTKTGKAPISTNLDDPLGLDPTERARYEYIKQNPSSVNYTWNEIPDEGSSTRKVYASKGTDARSISKLFTPDADIYSYELMKKKEEPAGPWTITGTENLQFSQLALSNWIKGGDNSASLLHDFRLKITYAKARSSWETNLTHKLGFTYTSELSTRVTSDEINIDSKYGFNAVNKWYYSTQTTLKTQFCQNYSGSGDDKELKSTFFSPAYLQFIFGMDYKTTNLSVLLSPYTAIITIVADTVDIDQTDYGIGENSKSDFVNGFSVTVNWTKDLTYGVTYTTKMELFYEYFKKNGNKRFDWENVIDVQINRYLSTRFLLEFRYYDNESTKFQVKENFSISFKYTFG